MAHVRYHSKCPFSKTAHSDTVLYELTRKQTELCADLYKRTKGSDVGDNLPKFVHECYQAMPTGERNEKEMNSLLVSDSRSGHFLASSLIWYAEKDQGKQAIVFTEHDVPLSKMKENKITVVKQEDSSKSPGPLTGDSKMKLEKQSPLIAQVPQPTAGSSSSSDHTRSADESTACRKKLFDDNLTKAGLPQPTQSPEA